MNDFSSVPIPSAGGMLPSSFAPLPPPLAQMPVHDAASPYVPSAAGNHERSLSDVVAQPPGQSHHEARLAAHAAQLEAQHEEAEAQSAYAMHVGTGGAFKRTGRGGVDKTLSKMALQKKVSFAGVSGGDRKMLGDVIEKHARNVSTGSHLSYSAKKAMKEEIQEKKDAGQLSAADMRKFKTVIDKLDT